MQLIKSIPFQAKDLKKELIASGIKVAMCKNGREGNALIAIESSLENQAKFISFCKENNYAGICKSSFRENIVTSFNYVDYGNIFKYEG